jgi:nucleoside-diphosphate-sugar epimerase
MSSPKLVAVYGATGSQGGSVVQSLLQNKDHTFTVRGITRNPDSEKAKALAAQGVEVVKADGFNKDQMVEAFKDCWGAFINTNSDDTVCSLLIQRTWDVRLMTADCQPARWPDRGRLGQDHH